MDGLQAFQTVARASGFIEINDATNSDVLWLKKNPNATTRDTHQLMCIDSRTKNVTVFWMTAPGQVNSKTFRGVPALQKWLCIAGSLATVVFE
jgi:hypothetical protein